MDDKNKTFEHPLEGTFEIEANTTESSRTSLTIDAERPLVIPEDYDAKDCEVEQLFDDVYDNAMQAFREQQAMMDIIPLTSAARNGEISVQFLNSALAAAKEKANLKQHKDKIELKKSENETKRKSPKTVNNNIVIDTNELLRLALQGIAKDITPVIEPNEKRKINKPSDPN